MIAFSEKRGLLLPLALLWCGLAYLPAAQAGDKVKVTLVAILATTRNEKVDPLLKCIAKEVCKKEKGLKGFRIVCQHSRSLATGEQHTFKLLDGQEAVVEVHHGANKDNRVELKVKPPLQGDIVYVTVCKKYLPIVTRYTTKKNGDRLILAVMVEPCQKK